MENFVFLIVFERIVYEQSIIIIGRVRAFARCGNEVKLKVRLPMSFEGKD